MGLFPAGLNKVIKAGEKLLEDRLNLLKIADLFGRGSRVYSREAVALMVPASAYSKFSIEKVI